MALGARQAGIPPGVWAAEMVLGVRQAASLAGLLVAARRQAVQQEGQRAFQRAKSSTESMNVRS